MNVVPITSDGLAAAHGPWCEDTQSFPPPPQCVGCADDEPDGAPCCMDPGCPGNPCTFPGYADNH